MSKVLEIKKNCTAPIKSNASVIKIDGLKIFLDFIEKAKFYNFPKLFVFVVYVDEYKEKDVKNIFKKLVEKFKNRAMVFEIKSKNDKNCSSEIFYKENGENEKFLKYFKPIEEKNFKLSPESFKLPDLIKSLRDLTKENQAKFFENVQNSKNVLCLRILGIFYLKEDEKLKILQNIVGNSKDIELFYAALDLSFEFISPEVLEASKSLIVFRTQSGESLLKILISKNEENLVNFLLNNFGDFIREKWNFEYMQKLSEIAYVNNFNEIFEILIDNDFPFPEDFSTLNTNFKLIKIRQELGNYFLINFPDEEIKKFIKTQKLSGIFYDTENISLIRNAIDHEKFELYGFLKSRGFGMGKDENDIKDKLSKLKPVNVKKIDESTLKYALPHEDEFASFLTSKSNLHDRGLYEKEEKMRENILQNDRGVSYPSLSLRQQHNIKINEFFKKLCEIPKVQKIIRVVVLSGVDIKIHFDFFESFIHQIKIGKNLTMGEASANGMIIIAAKDELMALQTLAHELTHLAMLILYENNWKPYKYIDEGNSTKFNEILEECWKKYDADILKEISDKIVPRVFHYEINQQIAELIVRVPEMYARFHDHQDRLKSCQENYPELFKYFDEKVLKDLENFNADAVMLVKVLNSDFGMVRKYDVEITDTTEKIKLIYDFLVVETKVPKIALSELRKHLRIISSSNTLFVNFEDFKSQEIRQKYSELVRISEDVRIIVDFSSGDLEELKTIFAFKNNVKFIIVTYPEFKKIAVDYLDGLNVNWNINKKNEVIKSVEINYSWFDLSPKSQLRILETKINFQNYETLKDTTLEKSFFEIMNCLYFSTKDEEKIFSQELLDILLTQKNLIFNKLEKCNEIHIERIFEERKNGKVVKSLKIEDFFKTSQNLNKIDTKISFDLSNHQNEENESNDQKMSIDVDESDNRVASDEISETSNQTFLDQSSSPSTSQLEVKTQDSKINQETSTQAAKIFDHPKELNNPPENLKLNQKDLNINQDQTFIQNQERDQIKISKVQNKSKVLILSGISGGGKTQAFKKVEEYLANKENLVYFISLQMFVEDLKKYNASQSFRDFFIGNFLKEQSKFEKIIFESFYDFGKIFFLFDGFDEISPDCKDQTLDLIKSFNEHQDENQLWITTRTHLESEICDKLELDSIFTLKPFTSENIKDFLREYFISIKITENIEENVEMLEKKISKGLKETDLIGVPQLLKLFADACVKDGKIDEEFLKNLTKFKIYREAISKKIDTWTNDRGTLSSRQNLLAHENSTHFNEPHVFFALMSFKIDIEKIFGISLPEIWTKEEIVRCGIITSFQKEIPNFQHETLKEFFAAKFVLGNLVSYNEHWVYHKDIFELLFKFLMNTNEFSVVNMFISGGIREIKFNDEKILKFAKILEETFKNENYLLRNSVLENFESLYKFLFRIFKKFAKDVKFAQLKRELEIGENVSKVLSTIPENMFKARMVTIEEAFKQLFNDENFTDVDKKELNEKLDEFMKKLNKKSPVNRKFDDLIEKLREASNRKAL
jgi:hypothetical protein